MADEITLANLAAIADRHAAGLSTATAIPRLIIWRSVAPTEQSPAMFKPKFYLLAQGAKRLTIGGQTRMFTRGDGAVSAVSLPFTSQVIEASRDTPYIGVELGVSGAVLADLLMDDPVEGDSEAPAIATDRVARDVLEPFGRLVGLLDEPDAIPMLAPLFERELYYRLLQTPMGATLRQSVQRGTRFHQIRTAVDWISGNPFARLRVDELAASVGMSATSFHRHFKALTAYTPLAYQRHIRLVEARRRLAAGMTNVTATAFATGYASPSQFSREYRRLFGVPPVAHAA